MFEIYFNNSEIVTAGDSMVTAHDNTSMIECFNALQKTFRHVIVYNQLGAVVYEYKNL